MEPLAAAARAAASPLLDSAVPLVDHISPGILSASKGSLLKGLVDAVCAGIGLSSIVAAAEAAHAGYTAAREEALARAALAVVHNALVFDSDPEAGEDYDGPQVLLPMSNDILVKFMNTLHCER